MEWIRLMITCCGMAVMWNISSECEKDEVTNCENGDSDTDW